MRDPDWGLLDVTLFTLLLVVVFLALPLLAGAIDVYAGIAALAVEVMIVGLYELGLMTRYKDSLSRVLPGQPDDDWERENL
jgi:hypothetical protein